MATKPRAMSWAIEHDDGNAETLTVHYDFTRAARATEFCPGNDASVDVYSITDADGVDVALDGHTLALIEDAALDHALEAEDDRKSAAEDAAYEAHRERVRERMYE